MTRGLHLPLALLAALVLARPPGLRAQDVPEGSSEAILEFAEGMRNYLAGRGGEHALQHFVRAQALDSSFAVALFFAGLQAVNMGQRERADSFYARAETRADLLSPYYRARIAASRASARGDLVASLEHARRAAEMAPGSKAVYNYALTAIRLNRPREGLRALGTLDPDREPIRTYPAYWGQLAVANHMVGDHAAELRAVEDRSLRFTDPLHAQHVMALAAAGRMGEARRHMDALSETGVHEGWNDPATMAAFWGELEAHGHGDAAREVRRAWLAEHPALGREGTPIERGWFARALYGEGRDDEARRIYAELSAENPDNLYLRAMTGITAARLGDRATADEVDRWLAQRSGGVPPTDATEWRAILAAARGDGEGAVRLFETAMGQGEYYNVWWHRDPSVIALAADPAVRRFLRGDG